MMTPQQVKDNAPEGATHYYQYKNGNIIYFKYFPDSGSLYRVTPNWTSTQFIINKLKPL